MSITITDPELEAKLAALGSRQRIKVKKTTMALAILNEAVADERGGPVDKWRDRARRFSKPEEAA